MSLKAGAGSDRREDYANGLLAGILVVVLIPVLWGIPVPSSADAGPALVETLRHRLEARRAGVPPAAGDRELEAAAALQDLYDRRLYRPVWFDDGRLSDHARAVTGLLASAGDDGLRPQDYAYTTLSRAIAARDRGEANLSDVELELVLTDAVLAYATDMLRGRVRPEALYKSWESEPRELDLVSYLQQALDAGRLVPALRDLAPRHEAYFRLRGLLAAYREIQRLGGLVAVPPGPALKPGMRSERVATLRRRLWQTGDLVPAAHPPEPALFDAELEAAVSRYQGRHGLETDGIAGAATIESLSVPISRRIRAIELNMERWRWLPHSLGERYITVNIAGFQMNLVEDGNVKLSMPVVVGKPYHATPVFSGLMTYLVFNPYWNVPHSIAVNEILPELRRDPAYLQEQSMRVFRGWAQPIEPINPASVDWSRVDAAGFPYRFRQEPGPGNALGLVKFMFPNKYNVYLHDTPAKTLFNRASRDFSHGCIRVSRPLQLAEYLLRGQDDWNAEKVAAAADGGAEHAVALERSWPVHLLYWTAWVGLDDEINFRPDVYGRDERLAEALYN